MKKSIILVFSLFLFLNIGIPKEKKLLGDCTAYFPMREGAEFVIKNYNSKGKYQGKAEHKVLSKDDSGGNLQVSVASKIFDKKDKELTSMEYQVRCVDGQFEFKMTGGLSMDQMAGAGMNTTVDGDFLDIPADASPGQDLKDGSVTVNINEAMRITTTISNRKVEAIEEITTEAGTFECIKITYDIETKMLMTIRGSAAEWYAKEVGMVRSESYNKKGKLAGYSELASLSN